MMATKHPTEAGAASVMPQNIPMQDLQPALTTNMAASSLTNGGNSCLDEQIERLKRCEYLREGEVKALCLRAREILVDESNVQRVDAPVTVSSVHGARLSMFPGIVCGDRISRNRYFGGNVKFEIFQVMQFANMFCLICQFIVDLW
jgi:hypothetical protein